MATIQHPPLEFGLLVTALDTEFTGLITGTGVNPRVNFQSKAVAAYVLVHVAAATPQAASAASIDGGFDHGIDSVYIAPDNTLWLVQSKFIQSGFGEPELGDVSKFRDGVSDLLRGEFARFNAALQGREAEIRRALEQEECRVQVILAHTGGLISDDRRAIFRDLEIAFNATNSSFLRCQAFGLKRIHDVQLDGLAYPAIDETVELYGYGLMERPYRAIYGRMQTKRLAEIHLQYGDRLVESNIRRYKGSSTVNDSLSSTLRTQSQHFFYFNNGVTFLCQSVVPVGPRDTNRDTGRFRVKGLSIINGAQTVGAIAQEPASHYEANPAEVLVTFISLENSPESFSSQVTQNRNRQNAVDLRDFAALDDNQYGWRETLGLAEIEYIFKSGEGDPPSSSTVFYVQEAAPALACCQTSRDWADFVVAAKSDKPRLYRKPELVRVGASLNNAYERLFTDSLGARELWRAVQISRFVQSTVKARATAEPSPAKEILQEGVWLVLHILLFKTGLVKGADLALTTAEQTRLSQVVDVIAQQLVTSTQTITWGKQFRSVFASNTDCQTLKNAMMRALPPNL